jgi:imidazolonepropionase-like amidohydrolase
MKTILTHCTVIDCTGQPPMKDTTVVIEGDKISRLLPGTYNRVAGEEEARVFDLEGGYLLPGLWNVHTHLGELLPELEHLESSESAIDRAIRCGRNAMDALRFGITSIRVVEERDFIDVAWKRAFAAGVFVGPRVFACGENVSHSNGPYEMRKAVRRNLKHGVDQIKLCITGGVATEEESLQESQLLLDEVKAATEVAHQKGKRVGAYAGGPAIKLAIQGGVDCIEHGYFLDDEAIGMMLDNDVFYVPTINMTQDEEFLRESGMADMDLGDAHLALERRVLLAKAEGETREAAKGHREGFQKALKAGVKIACGGDISPIGEFGLLEIEHLVRAGMTEMEALIAATRTGAELCGVVDRLGTVEVGKLADLIVLSADPLDNISNIRQLKLVLKCGKLVETRVPEGLADFWDLYVFPTTGPSGAGG